MESNQAFKLQEQWEEVNLKIVAGVSIKLSEYEMKRSNKIVLRSNWSLKKFWTLWIIIPLSCLHRIGRGYDNLSSSPTSPSHGHTKNQKQLNW